MAKKQDKNNKNNTRKVQTAIYLDRQLVDEITQMGKDEFRSVSQMAVVLINEAVIARRELATAGK